MAFLENGMMNQWISFLFGVNDGFTWIYPQYIAVLAFEWDSNDL